MLSVARETSPTDGRVLRIYVAAHCTVCIESRRLARRMAQRLTGVVIEVVDIDRQEPIDNIFAVPTFCYRGQILALGNPDEETLISRILDLDRGVKPPTISKTGPCRN